MKYDIALPSNINAFRDFIAPWFPGDRPPLWVAGSVREGEEALVLEAHRALRKTLPGARLILAPRHLNRASSTLQAAGALGLACALRSQPPTADWDVLLLDSIGELLAAYAVGDVSFVGGSLVPLGGQNLLEPALVQKPVLFGPSTENFRLEAIRLETSGGGIRVESPSCLAGELSRLLRDPARLKTMGIKALAVVEAHRGATARNADLLATRIGAPPKRSSTLPTPV
jgi:3-deoxy-D-manno-octulosonic-acid transferase